MVFPQDGDRARKVLGGPAPADGQANGSGSRLTSAPSSRIASTNPG